MKASCVTSLSLEESQLVGWMCVAGTQCNSDEKYYLLTFNLLSVFKDLSRTNREQPDCWCRVQVLQRPISVYCLPTVLPFLTDTVPFFHSFPPLFWVINATSILLVDVLPLPSTTGLIVLPQPLLLWFLFSLAALWSSVAPMCSYCECLVSNWRC